MQPIDLSSPWIICDQETGALGSGQFLGGQLAAYSARCPTKTTANEDAAAVIPFDDGMGVLLVADGMGGHANGEQAAQAAIQAMVTSIEEARLSSGLLRSGIINGFEQANKVVQAFGTGAATTLAAVELNAGF